MPNRNGNSPSLKDIAKRLKLAPSTVTRALSDHPAISNETKKRVRRVAQSIGYVADTAARLMRGVSSNVIGLLIANVDSPFYAPMANALAHCCNLHGFQLTLGITEDDPQLEYRHLHSLVANRAAGVVIVPSFSVSSQTKILLRRLPFVQLNRRIPSPRSDSFLLDEHQALFDSTKHLLELGHSKIAFVGAPIDSQAGAQRFSGYRDAMSAAARFESRFILETPMYGETEITRGLFKSFYEVNLPTAVVCSRTGSTAAIAQAIDELQLDVPGELSIVGFGDPLWPKWWRGGLTTLQLPIKEIAQGSGERLIERIRGKVTSSRYKEVMLPCPLMVRQSTGPARAPDKDRSLARAEGML